MNASEAAPEKPRHDMVKIRFWDGGEFTDLGFLPLPIRTYNILKRAGFKTFLDLRVAGPDGIKALPGMGKHGWNQLVGALDEFFKGEYDLSPPVETRSAAS